jgi:hypothetical protein
MPDIFCYKLQSISKTETQNHELQQKLTNNIVLTSKMHLLDREWRWALSRVFVFSLQACEVKGGSY